MDNQARILNFKPQPRLGSNTPAAERAAHRGLSRSPAPGRPSSSLFPNPASRRRHRLRVKPFPLFLPHFPQHMTWEVPPPRVLAIGVRGDGVWGVGGWGGGVWRKRGTRAHTPWEDRRLPPARGFLRPPGQCVRGRVCVLRGGETFLSETQIRPGDL